MLKKYFADLTSNDKPVKSRFPQQYVFILFCTAISSIMISIFLMQLFLILLLVLYLFERFEYKKNAVDGYIIVFFLFGIIRILSIIFSNYPATSIPALYKESLLYIGILVFGFYVKVFYKKMNTILVVFLVSSVFVALVGIVKFDLRFVNRSQSFSSGYSVFSLFLMQSFIITLFIYRELKFKYSNWIWTITLVFIFTALITSLGRTNIAIAFFVLIFTLIIKKIDLKLALIVLVLAGALSFISFQLNDEEIKHRIESPAAFSDRDILWEGASLLAFDHPLLGFGPRTFKDIFPLSNKLEDKGIGSWHNEYIEIYFESGIIGIISYLFLIFYIFRGCIRYLKKNSKNDLARSTVHGILIVLIGFCLASLTSGFITSILISVQFAFFVALLSSIERSIRLNE